MARSVSLPVRVETGKRLEDVSIALINELRNPKITWHRTINNLIDMWKQRTAAKGHETEPAKVRTKSEIL